MDARIRLEWTVFKFSSHGGDLMSRLLALFLGVLSLTAVNAQAVEKDWTILVFLNGNNNLDSFGALNINEMEKVGSTDKVNVVVQWASMAAPSVKRLYIQKDNDTNTVTSPVIEDIGVADMGDWNSLVAFVQWAKAKYPAKHYMLDIWNHGGGWHFRNNIAGGLHPTDISWDDKSGHVITTEQLGQAMTKISEVLGQKLDILGADACLMAMAEVTGEFSGTVDKFVGSQETEPGAGWPYDTWLARVVAKDSASSADVGQFLAEEYRKSYQGGSHGTSEVTFSVLNMDKTAALESAMQGLAKKIAGMTDADVAKIRQFASQAQSFYSSDYVDLIDFLDLAQVNLLDKESVSAVRDAVRDFVATSQNTSNYAKAHGVSVWMPTAKYSYDSYSTRYHGLQFAAHTGWASVLEAWFKNDHSFY